MANLCIIPARGGSKRIPRKNIKDFLGKPIIAYSIEAAINSKLFDEVMVSTDDTEIAEIARKYGASVPFIRSKKNSDDFASTIDVIEEVIEGYKSIGLSFKYCCCIYATAPFISAETLIKGHNLLVKEKLDCIFPALEYNFPIQRALKRNSNGKTSMFQPEYLKSRSQDLEKSYHDAGQFYFFGIQKVLDQKKLWTDNTGAIVVDAMNGQDIDNMDDWKIAEFKFRFNTNKSQKN